MNIPNEAIEAAAEALFIDANPLADWRGLRKDSALRCIFRSRAIRSIEAAAPHMLAGITALANDWESRGTYDMAYSKTMSDEEAAIQILANGAELADNARLIRNAINNEGTTMPGQPETLLEDTDPATVFTISLSVTDAVDAIEDHLRNDDLTGLNTTAVNIWGILIDASNSGSAQ